MMKRLLKFNYLFVVLGLFIFTACQEEEPLDIAESEEAVIDLRDDGSFDVVDGEETSRLDWMKRLRGRRPGFGRLNQCFDLVFPVTLEFPDGTTAEVSDSDDLKTTIREWKQNNESGIGGRPQLAFPFEVELADGDIFTVTERADLKEIAGDCYEGRPHYKGRFKRCYNLVYPVEVSYPDGSTAEAADRAALHELLKTWREENPDAEERPTLVYPLDIELTDGTVVTVGSREEIKTAVVACGRKRPHIWRNKCFDLVFPITVELEDEELVEAADLEALLAIYKEWLESYPRGDHPEIVFPYDVTLDSDGSTLTINSLADLEELQDTCRN